VLHTRPGTKDADYGPLLGLNTFDGASVQISHPFKVFNETLQWVQNSANSGHKWVVANDEQGPAKVGVEPDAIDSTHHEICKEVLWGNIMAGGSGVEYLCAVNLTFSDPVLEDFQTVMNMFDQSCYALEFFQNHSIPFWDMSNANSRLSSSSTQSRCLAQSNGDVILIQLVNATSSTTTVDLTGDPGDTYSVEWFDPFTGSSLILTGNISISDNKPLGNHPYNTASGDWVVLLKRLPNTS
jgi:hypothetical protein